jgi:outer membrane lipoprotein LolB
MQRFFLLSLLVALLSACASIAPKPVTEQSYQRWNQRLTQLQGFNQWAMRGRVALFVNDDVYNLGMGWIRERQHHVINLEAALGQGMIQLDKKPGQAQLTTSEGETSYGNSAQQLLLQATGLTLPVEGLESWVKGIPHNNSSYVPKIDAEGRVISLSQDGWNINYFDYQPEALSPSYSVDLPHKLYLKQDHIALKIVIDQWHNEIESPASPLFSDFPE